MREVLAQTATTLAGLATVAGAVFQFLKTRSERKARNGDSADS